MNNRLGQPLFSSTLPPAVMADIRALLEGILAALPASLAILDENGVILAVNRAWRAFADANGLNDPTYGVGESYFAVCETKIGIAADLARTACDGLRQV